MASIVFGTILCTQIAQADNSTSNRAFIPGDSRSVKSGYFQEIFNPVDLAPPPVSFINLTKHDYSMQAQLPPCGGNLSGCIESVQYQLNNGAWESATAGPDEGQRYLYDSFVDPRIDNPSSKFSEDLSKNLPEGNTARVWSFPGAPHGGGTGYLVSASISGNLVQNGSKYSLSDFNLRVLPVARVAKVSEPNCPTDSIFEPVAPDSTNPRVGFCEQVYDFPATMRIRVQIKLGQFLNALSGWFDGRLYNPSISVDSTQKTVTFEGSPVTVPTVVTTPTAYGDIPATWPDGTNKQIQSDQTSGNEGWTSTVESNTNNSINIFNQFGDAVSQRAAGMNTIWKISSLHGDTHCISSGEFNGVLSTNAPIYTSAPPTWNDSDKSLNFQVASSHLDASGNVFKGYYSLLMSESTATCL